MEYDEAKLRLHQVMTKNKTIPENDVTSSAKCPTWIYSQS